MVDLRKQRTQHEAERGDRGRSKKRKGSCTCWLLKAFLATHRGVSDVKFKAPDPPSLSSTIISSSGLGVLIKIEAMGSKALERQQEITFVGAPSLAKARALQQYAGARGREFCGDVSPDNPSNNETGVFFLS